MTTNSAHFGDYPLGRPLSLPAPRFEHWAAITATISRVFGRLAAAATMEAADPSGRPRRARAAYLDQSTMSREMFRL
jgi:hypothetical protein